MDGGTYRFFARLFHCTMDEHVFADLRGLVLRHPPQVKVRARIQPGEEGFAGGVGDGW